MKIIASVDNFRFIAELTAQEIDFLAGKQIGTKEGYYNGRMITAGTTFNIVQAFNQIHRNNTRKREIETVRKTLEGVINTLDIIDPFIEEPKLDMPEPPKEG